MEIRRLTATDAESYRIIRLEALKHNPEAFSSSYEEELEYSSEIFEGRLSSEYIYTFGAFVEKRLVGTVTLICETKIKIKHRATIVAMYVLPEHRKSGVGKTLMNAVVSKANDLKGIEQVYLAVTASNEPAKRLYNQWASLLMAWIGTG